MPRMGEGELKATVKGPDGYEVPCRVNRVKRCAQRQQKQARQSRQRERSHREAGNLSLSQWLEPSEGGGFSDNPNPPQE